MQRDRNRVGKLVRRRHVLRRTLALTARGPASILLGGTG
jgi:hypothetical protein